MDYKEFDKIRPYHDHEVNDAIRRMLKHPHLHAALEYLFLEEEQLDIIAQLKKVESSLDFQKVLMYPAIKRILKKTSGGLSLSNEDSLKNMGSVVFVANHRDILLDSALLQMVLVDLGMETSEITFGSNLMINDFIIDFGKTNRMYTVFRDGSAREMLENSKRLSAYIHHTIQNKKRSSWIAQRKGRTKNGLDQTDTTVLKMLTTFDKKNPIEAYKAINIVPVIISYEYEPCDLLKIRERYFSKHQSYKKEAGEDLKSVLNGITQDKGHIHLAIGKPVNQYLESEKEQIDDSNVHQKVAEYIDSEVYKKYQLYSNNYWALDQLNQTSEYQEQYSEKTGVIMNLRLEKLYQLMDHRDEELKHMFLEMYANPLVQKLKYLK